MAESDRPEARLEPGTLAAFIHPLKWSQILALDKRMGRAWWREAVCDADCRGLLEWDRLTRRWGISPNGRKAIRDVS